MKHIDARHVALLVIVRVVRTRLGNYPALRRRLVVEALEAARDMDNLAVLREICRELDA
jgi:hypothetical protein